MRRLGASVGPIGMAALIGLLGLIASACGGEARSDEPATSASPTTGEPGDGDADDDGGGDGDGDGAPSVAVQILGINDFHGHLEPPDGASGEVQGTEAGGVAHLAAHVATLRAGNPNTIVVSAGDLVGASPLVSGLFHDEPTIVAMNLLGLELNAVGNHEFDEGQEELLRLQEGGCHPLDGCQLAADFPGAEFEFLAANVVLEADETTLLPGVAIRDFDGIPVAFIGMTLEGTPQIVSADGISGLRFEDEVETVNALVPALRAEGIEAIVVLVHEGGQAAGGHDGCVGLSGPIAEIVPQLDPAVDVVLTGHTHQAYNCLVGDVIVTSAGSYGRLVTDIDLVLDRASGDVISKSARNVVATRDVEDPEMAGLVDEVVALAAPIAGGEFGTITSTLSRTKLLGRQSALGMVVADAQLAATAAPADGGAQLALMNPGGVRTDMVYEASGDEGDGVVTYGEAFEVQPFGNGLVVMTLTGAQLQALLEQQFEQDVFLQVSAGFSYTIDWGGPAGDKVPDGSVTINGVPVQAADAVRVTVNSYIASGGDGFSVLTEGTDLQGGPVDLEALQAYFEANSPVAPPAFDRVLED